MSSPQTSGGALLELAHGGHAARVVVQHDVQAASRQEAEVAFVRLGVGAMAGDTPWRVIDRLAGMVIIARCGWYAFLAL
jgi:hypothetical protein